MSVNEAVGHRIREQREKLGLKQHDIANALQVSPQAVSKWERGENAPDISLLVPLAKLLGVSTDNLLGYHDESPDVFEATVFFAVVEEYAKKAQTMPPKAVATWANGFFFQLTEAILHYDGIPVKYMGDTFLCFFSGPNHQQRAVQAAFHAKSIVTEKLVGAINSGEIYLGTVGHPDYARPDIMGDTVNIAFMTMKWTARNANNDITATASVVEHLGQSVKLGDQYTVEFPDTNTPVIVYEMLGIS
jgi:class 3 adenylate cyclase